MAGVGTISEVLRALQEGFQHHWQSLFWLKIKVLPKSFNIRLRTKRIYIHRSQHSHLTRCAALSPRAQEEASNFFPCLKAPEKYNLQWGLYCPQTQGAHVAQEPRVAVQSFIPTAVNKTCLYDQWKSVSCSNRQGTRTNLQIKDLLSEKMPRQSPGGCYSQKQVCVEPRGKGVEGVGYRKGGEMHQFFLH